MSDSEQSTNFAEYSYEKAITGKDKAHRALYITGIVFIMISRRKRDFPDL